MSPVDPALFEARSAVFDAAMNLTGHESKIILLIEDNIDDERLTLRAMRRNNVMNEVVVAYSGEEALEFLFKQDDFEEGRPAGLPAVVVVDLKLPKMDGLEVIRRIRENPRTRWIPVVVLTTSDDASRIDAAYRAGANSFVKKPTEPGEFSEAVLQLAMYWLLLNQTPRPGA